MGARRAVVLVVATLELAEQAWLLTPFVKRLLFPPHEDPAIAGRRVAERLGCFSCHGPEAASGIRNPGSDNATVPAVAGGEMMMWADDEDELRSWVLDGRRSATSEEDHGDGRAVTMPAFRAVLSAGELDALVAYVKSISGLQFPDDDVAARGLELMHDYGCFRCHGPMGTGGVANPRSLKGYVPGFGGEDYDEIVGNEDELRQWIRNGVSDRFAANPLARAVLERQAISMPAYGDLLADAEIEQIATAVEWLAAGRWRDAAVP